MKLTKVLAIAVISLGMVFAGFGCEGGEGAGWSFGSDHEYATRDDGLEGLYETYGFEFDHEEVMDAGVVYAALRDGEVDVAMGYSTDGRVEEFGLMNLEDGKEFHPVYNVAPIMREDVYEAHPELEEILEEVSDILDNDIMQNLNRRVDIEDETPEEVAEDFLLEHELITGEEGNGEGPTISVGSKEYTEQLILGQMTVILLEEHGFDVEDNTGLGGTDVLRQALLDGDVDVHWEYTGTGLMAILGHDEAITDSEECYQVVKEEDYEENGIVWLDYSEANNTYTIMMREDDAEAMGIESISDLAEAINAGETPPTEK